jgi:hypothetical protein
MPTLCATFRKEAGIVWVRMRKAAALGLSLSEETLTECALYNIALAHQGKDILIDLATKPAESKHGADWEWWLVRGGKGVGFRVQAKRLFADGRYKHLKKTGANPYEQLDKLVFFSIKNGFEPLYCFYNFAQPQAPFKGPNACWHSYRAPSFWGCSIAFPDQVKKAQSDRLAMLKSIMHPWHLLVCESTSQDVLGAAASFVAAKRGEDHMIAPRDLPEHVRRLIHLGEERRRFIRRDYLDSDFWDAESESPDDPAGLVVFRDVRD